MRRSLWLLVICLWVGAAFAQAPRPPIDKLRNLTDVNISSPADTEVLTYDLASQKWKNAAGGGQGGGAPVGAHYVTTQTESGLSNEFSLGSLASGLLKQTVAAGVSTPEIAVSPTDYQGPLDKTYTVNVKDPPYNAAGDGVTDDSAAIQSAITDVFNSGGGTVFFPRGIYLCNGAFDGTTNSVLKIPFNTYTNPLVSMQLLGEAPDSSDSIAVVTLPTSGSIIKCTKTGTGQFPSIIAAASPTQGTDFFAFSAVSVNITNLQFRTYDNPSISAIAMRSAGRLSLNDVGIQTVGGYPSQPTYDSVGAYMPALNNYGLSICNRVHVTGYNRGVVAGEHFNAQDLCVSLCNTGIEFGSAFARSKGNILAIWCPTLVAFTDNHQVDLVLNLERTTSGGNWFQILPNHDVYDPSDVAKGVIKYNIITAGEAPSPDPISVTGTNNVRFVNLYNATDQQAGAKWKFVDPTDQTKKMMFDLSGITTLTTRTLKPQNGDSSTVPSGGTTDQVLAKNSNTDFDFKWASASGGGNVSNSGTPTIDQTAVWTDATHIKGVTTLKGGSGSQVLTKSSATDYDYAWATPGTGGNVSTSGTIVTGQLAEWTDATHIRSDTTAQAKTAIGATTVGGNLISLTNPGAITFLKINADNTVTAQTAANFKTDLSLNNVTNDAQIKASDFPATSVDSEVALFNSTTGKSIKRATGTGVVNVSSGIYQTPLSNSTVGTNFLTLTNPSAITFPRINADNTVSALTNSAFKTALSLTSTDVGLGSVTNDAQTKASIVPNDAPTAGQILIGNGTSYAKQTVSGSGATVTLGSTGVLTLSAIPNATLSNSSITIAGTSTSLGGSITQDTITGLASTGIVKRTGANTLGIAASGTDYEVPLTFSQSLNRATNTVTLLNDSASPGNSQYYGTNASGTKGYFALPSGGGNVSNSGTPTTGQTAVWTDATHIQGVTTLAGGSSGQVLKKSSATDYDYAWDTVSGTGDVVGPASATDKAIARFNTTTGKLIQNSVVTIADGGTTTVTSPNTDYVSIDLITNGVQNSIVNSALGLSGYFPANSLSFYAAGSSAVPLSLTPSQAILSNGVVFGWQDAGRGGTFDTGLERISAGLVGVNNATAGQYRDILTRGLRSNAVTFANAIASPVDGTLQAFTDSSTNTQGATITGGGSNHVVGYYNGTNWIVTSGSGGGGGNVSNSGTPTADQLPIWTDDTHIKGVTVSGSGATISLANTGVITISAIANASLSNSSMTIAGTSTSLGGTITQDTITGLSTTGLVKRTAANTLATVTAPTGDVVGTSDTQTLTNKRINPRTNATTSNTNWTPNSDSYDEEIQTALAGDATINAPSGTPVQGQKLILRITSNASPHNLSFNGTYTAIGVTIPTSIAASKTIYVGCIYNSTLTRWDVVAVATQA